MGTVIERHNKDSCNWVQHREKRASNYIVIFLQNDLLLPNSLWHRHFLNAVYLVMTFSSMISSIFLQTRNFSILNVVRQGHFSEELFPFVHCSFASFIWCLFIFFSGKCNVFNLPFYCLLSFAGPFFISSQVIFLITVSCNRIKLAIISKLCRFTACLVFHLPIYCQTITLTTLTSTGQVTWQSRNSPGWSWRALMAATQMLEDPTSPSSVLLSLLVMNWEGLFGDTKVGSSIGSSDREIVKFSLGWGRSRSANKITAIDFRRDDQSFRECFWKNPMEKGIKGKWGPRELVDIQGSLPTLHRSDAS